MDNDHETVRSLQNPRVKNLVRLREGNHRRRQGKFIIEGRRELERALQAGVALEELYYASEFFRNPSDESLLGLASAAGAHLCRLSPDAFAKCSYREGPDGLLAIAATWERSLDDLSLGPNPLLLIVERVEKPGNLGTLMRTAAAAGVDGLIVTDPVADIFNPNAIRASQGVCFDLTVAEATNQDTRLWLSRHGLQPVVTSPDARRLVWEVDWRRPSALVVGSESDGLSPFWLDGEAEAVKIPMAGLADSLNVAAAAAVGLFEAVRQRTPLPPVERA